MGTAPQQNSGSTVKCLICGRLNPVGRLYCQFCKQRLPDPQAVGPIVPVEPAVDPLDNNQVAAVDAVEPHADRLEANDSVSAEPAANPPDVKESLPGGLSELETLQAALKTAQDEYLALNQSLGPLRQEFAELKAAVANPEHSPEHIAALTAGLNAAKDEAAKLASHVEGWKDKWKSAEERAAALEAKLVANPEHTPEHVAGLTTSLNSAKDEAARQASHAESWKDKWQSAEEKAAALEAKLAAKTQEFEAAIKAAIKSNPDKSNTPAKSNSWLKVIFGAITLLGSLGGYGTGRYVQPKSGSGEKVKQLTAQVADDQQQIGKLRSELKSANEKADQVQNQSKTDLDSVNQKTSDLTAHQQQLQRQLNDANSQKTSIADQLQEEKADLEAANRKISALTASEQQLQHQLAEANAQKASASEMSGLLNAEMAKLRGQFAPKGALVWSGNLTGKRTIDIKNGIPDFGALSGALPQKLCKISTSDGRVKIKNRPSKNHLNDLSFDVAGSGLVQVKIDWELSQ